MWQMKKNEVKSKVKSEVKSEVKVKNDGYAHALLPCKQGGRIKEVWEM